MMTLTASRWWLIFFFSNRRRHTRSLCDWSSDVCSSDLETPPLERMKVYEYSSIRSRGGVSRRCLPGVERISWLSTRSEERRVGKECRLRWWPYQEEKKQ